MGNRNALFSEGKHYDLSLETTCYNSLDFIQTESSDALVGGSSTPFYEAAGYIMT